MLMVIRAKRYPRIGPGERTRAVEDELKIIELLFGCWHKRLSFPISGKRGQRRPTAAQQTGTYVVCLDCGKEFAYDWQQMRIVAPRTGKEHDAAAASLEAKAS